MTPVQSMGDAAVDPGSYEAIEHHVTGTQYKQHHIRVTNLSVSPLSSAPNLVSCKLKANFITHYIDCNSVHHTTSALFGCL